MEQSHYTVEATITIITKVTIVKTSISKEQFSYEFVVIY